MACTGAAGLVPQFLRDREWLEVGFGPPGGLIAAPMKRAVMQPAEGDGELVAHPAPERRVLRKPEMVRVRRPPTAQQARLRGHELEVIAVTVPPRLAQGQVGFVDPWSSWFPRGGFAAIRQGKRQGSVERQSAGIGLARPPAFARLPLSADLRW